MRISISPKDDKVNFEPVEVNTLRELSEYVTKYSYSTGIFKDNYRKAVNFISAESIALDIDNDDPSTHYSIEEAAIHFKDFKHLIMPSKSHRIDKNGRVADRFRVILFLDQTITDRKTFRATWKTLLDYYPAIDTACKDTSRYYYKSSEVYSMNTEGKDWPVTEYSEPVEELDLALSTPNTDQKGVLSRQTMAFLLEGADPGKRNPSLYKAAKDMQEQGYTIEECRTKVEVMIKTSGNWATAYLNDKDNECIESAYNDPAMYSPREGDVGKRSVFNFQTIDQMTKEAGDVRWLVDGLLSVGGFSLMVGPPKAGKSTLVRQLVKTVCQGGKFLDREVSTGGVVYLTFEEQPAILKEQFRIVGIKPNDNIMIHTGAVVDERALGDLEDAIMEFRPSLVILDTLFDISQLEDINSYKPVKDALSRVREIARKSDAHILGVHHSNKGGGFMGSQAIFGAVDTMIKFEQFRNERYLHSSGKHGTHYDSQEIVFNSNDQSYSLGKVRENRTDKL